MALFFFFFSSRKISRWGGLDVSLGFSVRPLHNFWMFDSFLLARPKVLDPTSTRNIIIRVYNLSASNPCVCVFRSKKGKSGCRKTLAKGKQVKPYPRRRRKQTKKTKNRHWHLNESKRPRPRCLSFLLTR